MKQKTHIAITILVMAICVFALGDARGFIKCGEQYHSLLIVGLTQLPEEAATLIIRKSAHVLEYMILGICFGVNVRDWKRKRLANLFRVKMMAMPWLLSSLYAVTDEIHQAFVRYRVCALMDVGIDSVGALFGCILGLMIWKNSQRVESQDSET